MEEIQPTVQRAYTATTAADPCLYCGAPLNPFYYFCLQCATPYKPDTAVLPAVHPITLTDGARIVKSAPQVWTVFWTYTGVIVLVHLTALFLYQAVSPALLLILSTLAILVTTIFFACWYWRSLLAQFKRIGFGHWAAWVGIAALPPLLGLNYVYHQLIIRLLNPPHPRISQELRDVGLGVPALLILICIFPAVTEEIAFRGLLQHWLATAVRPARTLAIAAALFAGVHFSLFSFPYLFLVGLLLGFVKQKTGSLYPSMLIHFLHNAVVILWFSL